MSTVNPPGSGTPPIPPSNEDEERNNQNNNDMNNQRPQTGHGEHIKGMTLKERMAAKKGGIKTADGVRQVQQSNDGNDNSSADIDTGGDN